MWVLIISFFAVMIYELFFRKIEENTNQPVRESEEQREIKELKAKLSSLERKYYKRHEKEDELAYREKDRFNSSFL